MKKFLLPVLAVMALCVVQQTSAILTYKYSSKNPQLQAVINTLEQTYGNNRGVVQQLMNQLMQQNPGKIKEELDEYKSWGSAEVEIG